MPPAFVFRATFMCSLFNGTKKKVMYFIFRTRFIYAFINLCSYVFKQNKEKDHARNQTLADSCPKPQFPEALW